MKAPQIFVIALFSLTLGTVIFSSCKHGCGKEAGSSTHNERKSHNMGLNCMNCHYGTGQGKGCFAVAGTVYNSSLSSTSSNPTVQLYTQPDNGGNLMMTIDGDEKGNFYDGKISSLTGSFYPVVISADGKTKKMLEPVSNGACNSCHGISTDRIWVD